MPGLDGSGPAGQGPMTGRGAGPCNTGDGYGRGRGFWGFGRGRGGGYGMGRGFRRFGGFGRFFGYGPPQNLSQADQKKQLKADLEDLEAEKKEIKKMLDEMK